jgi:hypothetical protein
MALDKSIQHRKDWRKPYYGSKRIDASCRPGGDCPYCNGNRTHKDKKKSISAKEQLKETEQ